MEERIACPRCGNACVPPRGGGAYRCPACRGLLTGPASRGGTSSIRAAGDGPAARVLTLRKRAAVWAGLTAAGLLAVLVSRLAGRPPAAALDPAFGPPFGVTGEGDGSGGYGAAGPSAAEAEARLRERVRGLEEDAAREPGAVDLWVNLAGLHVDLARRAGKAAAKVRARELTRARQALARGEAAARLPEEKGALAWWRGEVAALARGERHQPLANPIPLFPDSTSARADGNTHRPDDPQQPAHRPRERARDWQELLAKHATRRSERERRHRLLEHEWRQRRGQAEQALEARLEREIARHPDRPWPYLQLGRALLARAQDPHLGAGEFPADAMALGPTTDPIPDYSAHRREIERAILLYRRAAAVAHAREHRGWAYIRISDAWRMLRQPDRAKEALEKASQIQPHNPLVWARLAAVYSRLGQHANMAEATKRRAESAGIPWTYAEFFF